MMSYEYSYRHVTPPAGLDLLQPNSAGSNQTSRSARYTLQSSNASIHSVDTHISTPPISPPRHHNGRDLLPKIRTQDQVIEPVAVSAHHRNTSSLSSTGFPVDFNVQAAWHRSVSPPELKVLTPVSESSDAHRSMHCNFGLSATGHSSHVSMASQQRSHSRSSSVSNIDENAFRKYICPTNRAVSGPSHTTAPSSMFTVTASPGPLPVLAPYIELPQPRQTFLPAELTYDNYIEQPATSTLLKYLTDPNPSPSLVRRPAPTTNRQLDTSFWWDIRNVRTWSDFGLNAIHAVPNFTELLEFPIPDRAVPAPPRPSLNALVPETVPALQDLHSAHFLTKVNAALKVSLGENSLSLQSHKVVHASRQLPDFTANYRADYERTVGGETRARVVGLVRGFEAWNSGMRTSSPVAKISYLRELACLHRHMREHSCRYGFIVTEIELVCVRMGTESVPYFGFLELAQPLQLATQGASQLTAALGLWYLCMMAKTSPLPGQYHWKVDVGAPTALTRQKCLEKDQWMIKPEGREKRDAKRNRGWVTCDEPLSRKECGRPKRLSRV